MERYFIKSIICLIVIINVFTLCGCSKKNDADQPELVVKTMTLSDQDVNDYTDYYGYVKSEQSKNYSFLSGGKIEKIYVEEGQYVTKGTELAKLDTVKLEAAESVDKQSLTAAQAVYDKIKSNYDTQISTAESTLEAEKESYEADVEKLNAAEQKLKTLRDDTQSYEVLYENDAISAQEIQARKDTLTEQEAAFEKAKADINSKETALKVSEESISNLKTTRDKELQSAEASVEKARLALEVSTKDVKDAVIVAEEDGYITKKNAEEGETVSVGQPILIVENNKQIVSIGISVDEYSKVKKGMNLDITYNGKNYTGTVDTIALYPDESTRTYNVDISFEGDDIPNGALVNVKINSGSNKGYLVPLDAVINIDGLDYIYTVSEEDGKNIVKRKQVSKDKIYDSKILIKDISPQTVVITDNLNTLRENQYVNISK